MISQIKKGLEKDQKKLSSKIRQEMSPEVILSKKDLKRKMARIPQYSSVSSLNENEEKDTNDLS